MAPRRAAAALSFVLALATGVGGALATAPAQAAPRGDVAAPTKVRATVTLTGTGAHRVEVRGRAARGARVVLQQRSNRNQRWAGVDRSRARAGNRFVLVRTTTRDPLPRYRACVVGRGERACSRAVRPVTVRVGGDVVLTETASQVVESETLLLARGRLSPVLQQGGQVPVVQYADPATGAWTPLAQARVELAGDGTFTVTLDQAYRPFSVSKQQLGLRVVVPATSETDAAQASWTADAYARRSLGSLPVVSGSLQQARIVYSYLLNAPVQADAVAPVPVDAAATTATATLSVPAGCGRVGLGVTTDGAQGTPGPWTASLARNGVPVLSASGPGTPAGSQGVVTGVAAGDQLTLTTSVDPAAPQQRPWFTSGEQPVVPTAKQPYVLCANP